MDVSANGITVDEVIGTVKNAIKLAGISASEDSRDLAVSSVQLTLNTVASYTAGGGVDFRVPFLGMKLTVGSTVSRRDTHTLDIVLEPKDLANQREVRDGDVETALVEAIETIRAVTARAITGDDPFILKQSTIELTFAITKDGSITLGFNGEFEDSVSHTLRISFSPPP
jgi:Trypsin-co-occurring domain 2